MNQPHASQLRGSGFKSTTFRNPFDKANSSLCLSPPLLPSPVRRNRCSPGSGDSLVAVPVPSEIDRNTFYNSFIAFKEPLMSRCAGLLSLVVVLFLSSFARAQLAPDGVVADAMKAAGDGKTLQAISLLESHKDHAYNDILGALYSFVGNSEKAESLRPPSPSFCTAIRNRVAH